MADESQEDAPKKKPPMSDQERAALAAKLDAELETFMSGLERKRYTEGWPEDRWQEEMEKHPFFMTKSPGEGEEVSPLIQGLTDLKYDETDNTPTELAQAYKDDGNFNFKCKKYRFAILGYTEGLLKKCGDAEVESQLLNNRAAAHFELGNLRSCAVDCEAALKLKPDYGKARLRLAQCCLKLGRLDACVQHCDWLLKENQDDTKVTELRAKTIAAKKLQERDERKKTASEARKAKEEQRITEAIKERGIKMVGVTDQVYPGAVQTQVHLVEDRLVWPVLFLYPEVASSDLVQEFHEDSTFSEQLAAMFETCPDWDIAKQYQPDRLHVYFECKDKETLFPVNLSDSLGQILPNNNLVVRNGTPCFIIVVAGSNAEVRLIESYK